MTILINSMGFGLIFGMMIDSADPARPFVLLVSGAIIVINVIFGLIDYGSGD